MRFAVFASGEGTNLQAIIDAVKAQEIKGELVVVFSDKRKSNVLNRAKDAGIPTLCLERKDYATPQSYERDMVIHLKEYDLELIVFAGFMKVLTAFFVKQYPNQILNIHPSLLPSFKGKNGIKDTFTYGSKLAGVTIHFVDAKMDHGPIIMQESFKVKEGETLEELEARIHALEHRIYPKVIQMFIEGRLKIKGRKVEIS